MSDGFRRPTARQRGLSLLRRMLRAIPPLLLLTLGLVLWQVWTVGGHIPDYLLPSPTQIWRATIDERALLESNTIPTLEIALYGLVLALVLGVLLATCIHFSRFLEVSLYPILIASQSVPLIALAPILVVLLGFTIVPKLIIVCLICFFPVVVNTVDGFRTADPDLRNLLRSLGAGRWRVFRDVDVPTALPYLFSGAKVAATYSVVGAIVGEWVGSWQGLGYVMIQKMSQFDTAVIFSAMVILTAMGIVLFGIIALAERLLMPWKRAERMKTRKPYR